MYPALSDENEEYDRAKQIEAYEDSSFLVTEDGSLYSWGKNDNSFLGRETRLDMRSIGGHDDVGRKLPFSSFLPARVVKLEKFIVQRIHISDGKFMLYFVNKGGAPPSSDDLGGATMQRYSDD